MSIKEYADCRRERLNDVIFDYITDEDVTPDELYRDIKSEVESSLAFYQKYLNKCQNLLDLVNGLPARSIQGETHHVRSMISEEEYHEALIHANSPYNDGFTKQIYQNLVNEYEESNVGVTSDSDWEDFWCNDEDPYAQSSCMKSDEC